MSDFPYSRLQIPEKCYLDKRIYKKLFFENAKLTATDKKWFTKDIENIIWKYSLKPAATLIHAFKEEHYTYDEIAVIEVQLTDNSHINRLADIIHRVIPYPLLIVFKIKDKVQLSVADKRYNLADDKAATLNDFWVTDKISSEGQDEIDNAFLKHISYTQQPKLHLKVFYQGWIDVFIAYKAAQISGKFVLADNKSNREKQVQALNAYRDLQQEISELKTAIKKQEAFNEKVKLNVKLSKLKADLSKLEKQL